MRLFWAISITSWKNHSPKFVFFFFFSYFVAGAHVEKSNQENTAKRGDIFSNHHLTLAIKTRWGCVYVFRGKVSICIDRQQWVTPSVPVTKTIERRQALNSNPLVASHFNPLVGASTRVFKRFPQRAITSLSCSTTTIDQEDCEAYLFAIFHARIVACEAIVFNPRLLLQLFFLHSYQTFPTLLVYMYFFYLSSCTLSSFSLTTTNQLALKKAQPLHSYTLASRNSRRNYPSTLSLQPF